MTHKDQRDKQVAASLAKAGVGLAYHKRSLVELGAHGELLRSWVESSSAVDVRSGSGWTIIGKGRTSQEVLTLLARGVHLRGMKSRLVTLRRLVSHVMMGEGEVFEDLSDCEALFVMDFYQTYPGNELPVTGREVQEVETFLHERLDNNQAFFPHCAKALAESTWWSPALVQRIADANRTLEVQ